MADRMRQTKLARLSRDARGGRLRAARPRGRDVDRRPAPHRHLGFRLRRAGVRLLLPELGEQREAVAPKPCHRTDAVGAAVFAFSLAARCSAALDCRGSVGARRSTGRSRAGRGCSVLYGVGLQIWQLTELAFFPGSSGYASCFIAWATMNVVLLLVATYWLETTLAREMRLRRASPRRRRLPLGAAGRPTLPGQSRGVHVLLGLRRPRRHFFWVLFYVL